MSRQKPEQSAGYRQYVRDIFDTVAASYDNASLRYFPFCADYCVDKLKIKKGAKVLDIACGTGVVSTAAAQVISSKGRVMAIDQSPVMLDILEQKAKKMYLQNIDIHQMDAENLEFRKNYFDVSICSFGLFFMNNLSLAVSDWLRVTKPGGKVLFTSFATSAFQPLLAQAIDSLKPYPLEYHSHDAFEYLALEQNCEQLAKDAGLHDVVTEKKQFGFHLQSSSEWWDVLWNAGFRGLLGQLNDVDLAEFKKKHLQEIEFHKTDQGIWLDVSVIITIGHKPV